MKAVKFSSLKEFTSFVNPKQSNENWQSFLIEKGHTPETFSYLPDHLKVSLKFSFGKRQKTA